MSAPRMTSAAIARERMAEGNAALERELEEQLAENRSSLVAIEEALLEEHSEELVEMLDELQQAVKIAEQGLLNLKRSRLLRQIGIMEGADVNPPSEPLPDSMPAHHHLQLPKDHIHIPELASHPTGNSDATPEQTVQSESKRTRNSSRDHAEVGDWPIDSKCRFRHRDGRWYTGVVMATGSDREEDPDESGAHCGEVLLQFAYPTRESMKMCKFYLEGRCHFGDSCRFSHGFPVPSSSLHPYTAVDLATLPLGSLVWVVVENYGLWQKAELEARGAEGFSVALTYNGKRAKVEAKEIVALKYWDESEVEGHAYTYEVPGGGEVEETWEDGGDGEESDDEEDDEDGGGEGEEEPGWAGLGLGSFPEAEEMLKAGIQTETVNFAGWERHTRGMASKMMASMGFREGMGLGVRGQGIVAPIEVKSEMRKGVGGEYVKKGGGVGAGGVVVGVGVVEAGGEVDGDGGKKKKKSRGGERRRRQKLAAASRQSKGEDDKAFAPDLFSFINGQLSKSGGEGKIEGSGATKAGVKEGEGGERGRGGKSTSAPVVDRRALLAREDELHDLRSRIVKLEEMAGRNKRDKNVFAQVQMKLVEAKAALAKASGAHATARQDLHRKEQNKKWMKF